MGYNCCSPCLTPVIIGPAGPAGPTGSQGPTGPAGGGGGDFSYTVNYLNITAAPLVGLVNSYVAGTAPTTINITGITGTSGQFMGFVNQLASGIITIEGVGAGVTLPVGKAVQFIYLIEQEGTTAGWYHFSL